MKISILSMFPQLLDSLYSSPVIKRAILQEKVEIEVIDIKDFADGSFRHIDDSPYGGSAGMIMRMEPLVRSLESVKTEESHIVLMSPKGKKYNQKKARQFSMQSHLVIVCGHYEGVDSRFETYVDEQISIGDFIITGGEGAAALITDSVVRLLDGTLKDGVTEDESYENNLLEYPQYTHPFDFRGQKVPSVLLTGNTAEIERWKHKMAIEETLKHRPDMALEYMKMQIPLAEESFNCAFCQKIDLKNGFFRYVDSKLPDMYDHNMFTCLKAPGKSEIEEIINYQKQNGFDFLKIESNDMVDGEIVSFYGFETWKELTMALFDVSQADRWKANPDVEIKLLSKEDIEKEIVDVEMRNYSSVYGEDFTLRKIHRYLSFAKKSKKMEFVCAYLGEKIAGYLVAWIDNDCVGIDDLIVSPEFRNRKVATTLLKNTVKLAPFAYLHADEDDTPKDMYSKLGFKTVEVKHMYFKKL